MDLLNLLEIAGPLAALLGISVSLAVGLGKYFKRREQRYQAELDRFAEHLQKQDRNVEAYRNMFKGIPPDMPMGEFHPKSDRATGGLFWPDDTDLPIRITAPGEYLARPQEIPDWFYETDYSKGTTDFADKVKRLEAEKRKRGDDDSPYIWMEFED